MGAWHEWCVEHWGTKWDANFDGPGMALISEGADVGASVGQNGVVTAIDTAIYTFDTAWGPPGAWVKAVGAMEPFLTLTLTFGEPGGGFAGRVIVRNEEVEEEELPIDEVLEAEEMWF